MHGGLQILGLSLRVSLLWAWMGDDLRRGSLPDWALHFDWTLGHRRGHCAPPADGAVSEAAGPRCGVSGDVRLSVGRLLVAGGRKLIRGIVVGHPSVAGTAVNRVEVGSAHGAPPRDHDVAHLAGVARLHVVHAEHLWDLLVPNQLVADPFKRVL